MENLFVFRLLTAQLSVVISLLQHVMISLVIIFLINGLNVLFIKRQKTVKYAPERLVQSTIHNLNLRF